jgi:phytoene dehydrogenase-like protein
VAVRAADGEEIGASAVVSNVNTPSLVSQLVGREYFPSSYLRALGKVGSSLSVVQLHAGLDCRAAQAGVEGYLTTVFPGSDVDACIARQRASRLPEGYSVTVPATEDESVRGEKGDVVSVVGHVDPRQWTGLSPERYRSAKEECRAHMLGLLEQACPGFGAHCRAVDVATPVTFERFTGNPGGAIMGFSSSIGSHRPLLKVSRVPVRSLYLAGAWTLRFGGMMQAMRAGVAAAKKVLANATA